MLPSTHGDREPRWPAAYHRTLGGGATIEKHPQETDNYRALFDLAPIAYVVTDRTGAIIEANAAAARLLGVDPRALARESLAAFVAPTERDALLGLLRDADGAADRVEHEVTFTGRNGPFAAAVTLARVARDSGTDLVGWLIGDLTDRRRAEVDARRLAAELGQRVRERTGELERQGAMLQTVIEQMPAGVTIVDPANGQLLLANAQAWEISRARFDEPEGLEPLVRLLLDGSLERSEVMEVVRRDGSRGAIEVNAAPIRDPDGGVAGLVAIFQDVTRRERQERAGREFVSNAAHELQTPLTAITSAAEVLQAGAKEVPADRDRFLGHIQHECDRLARLVRALLVLARAQTSGEVAGASPVAIRDVLRAVAARLRPPPGVRLDVRCPARISALADRDLLEQAVENLASNALKYTSEGTVSLTARTLDDKRVAIEVTDTGRGIPVAERERVFERFYRAGTRDRSGFGLGLAIVEQAARALGGEVEFESPAGGGTTARLTLPAARGA